jgi:hypothetical protein
VPARGPESDRGQAFFVVRETGADVRRANPGDGRKVGPEGDMLPPIHRGGCGVLRAVTATGRAGA